MSTNNAGCEGDGAARDVDDGNGADDAFFEWLEAQLAPLDFMDLGHEGQGIRSNDVTPEGSNISDPDQGSNNVSTSDHDAVNDSDYASAVSQGHHVDGSATHVLNGDLPVMGPMDLYSCDCDDDDDDDWIAEVIESGILNIHEMGH